jgi:hypothetical protein
VTRSARGTLDFHHKVVAAVLNKSRGRTAKMHRFVFLPFLFLSGLQPLPPRILPRLTARPNPSSSIPLCPSRILARNRSRGALATSRPRSVARIRCRAWRWTRWTLWASPRRTSPSPNVSSLFPGYPLEADVFWRLLLC